MQRRFTNTFSDDAARPAFERGAVPETGRLFFEAGRANVGLHSRLELDVDDDEPGPLPFVAGDRDHALPAEL